ncbi:hypothetical protein CHELA1G11_10091 [Hyphomicrobiales bacterium]|nr:hypothetical protein CHELA1G11_10091 [Hyphomicrobiales bacterium]CAH1677141.1 hypothetical protein CHELA1G2_14219 [Hyphomicrobiales bacterium]
MLRPFDASKPCSPRPSGTVERRRELELPPFYRRSRHRDRHRVFGRRWRSPTGSAPLGRRAARLGAVRRTRRGNQSRYHHHYHRHERVGRSTESGIDDYRSSGPLKAIATGVIIIPVGLRQVKQEQPVETRPARRSSGAARTRQERAGSWRAPMPVLLNPSSAASFSLVPPVAHPETASSMG